MYAESSVSGDMTPCSPLKLKLATCFRAGFLGDIFFDHENGGDIFL
jgi:hypothetical protein